jgi:flagellin
MGMIPLTSGMRATLISLQCTVDFLNRTQNRLATGKKVNTALDNAVAFFAANSLRARATDLLGRKDEISQAIQTVEAANNGIKGITSLIEQARGIAFKAKSAERGTATATGAITLSGIVGYKGLVQQSHDTAVLTLTGLEDNNPGGDGDYITLKVDDSGGTYGVAAESGVAGYYSFRLVSGDMNATAQNMANKINSINWWYWKENVNPSMNVFYRAEYIGSNQVRISKYDYSTFAQLDVEAGDIAENPSNAGDFDPQIAAYTPPLPYPDTVQVGGVTFTAIYSGVPADAEFTATAGDDGATIQSLAEAIEAHDWSAGAYTFHASVSGGSLNLEKVDNATGLAADVASGDFDASGVTGGGSGSMRVVQASDELADLQDQYNELRDQLTALAADSCYKGINLLDSGDLTVSFENSTLIVNGFDGSAAGLGFSEAAWATGGSIDADLALLDQALSRLRVQSSSLASRLNIIWAQQGFLTDMANILTEGSDSLTLADLNEEGADMLMLQTRQSLSVNSLSLAATAAQSVLRLFG